MRLSTNQIMIMNNATTNVITYCIPLPDGALALIKGNAGGGDGQLGDVVDNQACAETRISNTLNSILS